jgi:hypothetical protein
MLSREATPWKGARSPSTSHVPVTPSRGARHDATHAGGRSQAEKQLREAAAILRIICRRKVVCGGIFRTFIGNDVLTRRRCSCRALPRGCPSSLPTETRNVRMDMGVVTVLRANETGGPIPFGGREEGTGVTTRPDSWLVGKQHPSRALIWSLLRRHATSPGRRSKLERQGGWSRRGSDTIWRRRPSGSTAAGKPRTKGWE